MDEQDTMGSNGNQRRFYAHTDRSNPDKTPEQGARWQLLEDHLVGTAVLAREFASAFGAGDWGYLAALWHDAGKYSEEFQEMLKASVDAHIEHKSKVDHSTFAAQQADQKWCAGEGKLLAYVIAGHHTGLPDGRSNEGSSLSRRLAGRLPYRFHCPDNLLNHHKPSLPFTPMKHRAGFEIALFVRMLYSSLVDADFLDTEKYMNLDSFHARLREYKLDDLQSRLFEYLCVLENTAEKTPVNRLRSQILDNCVRAADQSPGLFSLTVPTGGGKTLSSMAFALKHAVKHRHRRIIYAIPYTSIIEQNAAIFRGIFGDEAVLEHHSNYEPSDEDYRTRLASENWDAPIVVTTNVQFFESLFACRSSRCRKLHNIARSVIIPASDPAKERFPFGTSGCQGNRR